MIDPAKAGCKSPQHQEAVDETLLVGLDLFGHILMTFEDCLEKGFLIPHESDVVYFVTPEDVKLKCEAIPDKQLSNYLLVHLSSIKHLMTDLHLCEERKSSEHRGWKVQNHTF